MPRLLADENFNLAVVRRLRELGHDVVTVQQMGHGQVGYPDDLVLELARREDRAVLTFDRMDYGRLHSAGSDHAGIIACTVDQDFVALAARIHAALEAAGSIKGALIKVDRGGFRLPMQLMPKVEPNPRPGIESRSTTDREGES